MGAAMGPSMLCTTNCRHHTETKKIQKKYKMAARPWGAMGPSMLCTTNCRHHTETKKIQKNTKKIQKIQKKYKKYKKIQKIQKKYKMAARPWGAMGPSMLCTTNCRHHTE